MVCEPVDTPAEPTPDPAPDPEPETPRSRGRPKGAPNKVKPLPPAIEVVEVDEPVELVREKQKREKAVPKAVPKAAPKAVPKPKVQRDASPAPFEPTFEELLGHMGRAMAQQRAVRAQGRSDLYSQFLS